jgi:REP-associated tyrosine transposase
VRVSDEQVWTAVAYVALNPVSAGLCRLPEQWPWSSHALTIGGGRSPPWLDVGRLPSYFEGLGGDPRQRYAAMTVGV